MSVLGPYPNRPTENQVNEIIERLRCGERPSTLAALSLRKPDTELECVILAQPELPIDQHDHESWLPCALCSADRPKFMHGYIAWFSDGFLRLIGPDCGSKHFGDVAAKRLFDSFRRDQKRRLLEDELPRQLVEVANLEDRFQRVEQDALSLSLRSNKILKEIPYFITILRRQDEGSPGALVVEHRTSSEVAAQHRSATKERSRYEVAKVARLHGRHYLAQIKKVKSLIDSLRKTIRSLPRFEDEEQAFSFYCDNETRQEYLSSVSRNIYAVKNQLAELEFLVLSGRDFFSRTSLQEVQKWAADPRNMHGVRVRLVGKSAIITLRGVSCVIEVAA